MEAQAPAALCKHLLAGTDMSDISMHSSDTHAEESVVWALGAIIPS